MSVFGVGDNIVFTEAMLQYIGRGGSISSSITCSEETYCPWRLKYRCLGRLFQVKLDKETTPFFCPIDKYTGKELMVLDRIKKKLTSRVNYLEVL